MNPWGEVVGSGKGTPCECIQLAKLTPSRCIWACSPDPDELREFEPQAAIAVAATSASAAIGRCDLDLNMRQVLSG